MRRTEREALALGLLHGPVELVPVSSSGHVAALTWLLGWDDGARRKELEVALHTGSAAALVLVLRPRLRPALLAAASVPPAIAGLTLERAIEDRLGPVTLAAGLLAGALGLLLADRAPAIRDDGDARLADGIALGLAQTAALIPGVSRNGATLAAARARGFDRAAASRLSWEVALPVVAGATVLKGCRVAARARAAAPSPPAAAESPPAAAAAHVRALVLGAAAAFASTLATARLIGVERRGPLWRWAAWRVALAGAILAVRHNRSR
jgi:undecaprenyl-diphosphatase